MSVLGMFINSPRDFTRSSQLSKLNQIHKLTTMMSTIKLCRATLLCQDTLRYKLYLDIDYKTFTILGFAPLTEENSNYESSRNNHRTQKLAIKADYRTRAPTRPLIDRIAS